MVSPAPQTAFSTLPALRQRVQTYARVGLPPSSTRTRWRLGLKRRFVATIEWLRLFPKDGFFPQTAHTLAMGRASVANRRGNPVSPTNPLLFATTRPAVS